MIPDPRRPLEFPENSRDLAGLLTVNNRLVCRDRLNKEGVLASDTDTEIIRTQVDRILASGVLGRSRFYAALLKYLADCSDRAHPPKEIEIAAEVFNRGDGFDPSQDSMVRVYAHNLRQKLQQYYADQGIDEAEQVNLPKGEYRLVLGGEADLSGKPEIHPSPFSGVRIALIVAVSLAAGVALDRVLTSNAGEPSAGNQDVAESALWAPVTDDEVPVTIVVGDYYIFGELDEVGNVERLVREFSINSSRDLDERFIREPAAADRYIDLDLTYLPSSIAFAMRDLMGIFTAAEKEIRIVSMSNLDSSAIRESHIVYIGFLSGLGMLSDFVFSGSELVVGDTFDELIHRTTGDSFISEAGFPSGPQSYRDYGLFSTLPAPGGNQFVFVAGTRDEGLMQTAQAISNPAMVQMSIGAIASDGEAPPAFELLYEVAGLGRTNLDALIVHAAALDSTRISIGQLIP